MHPYLADLVTKPDQSFCIHGGGNIGLGLLAAILTKSKPEYKIIATSSDSFTNTIINSKNELWLNHGDDPASKIENIFMVPRSEENIIFLYKFSSNIALCLSPVAFEQSLNWIATGIYQRFQRTHQRLTLLIVMNLPASEHFVKNKLLMRLKAMKVSSEDCHEIIDSIDFIPCIADRIVCKIEKELLCQQLKTQLIHKYGLDSDLLVSEENICNTITKYNLNCEIYKAEYNYKLYIEMSYSKILPSLNGVSWVKEFRLVEEIKNKYINGPHAVLAWLGALFGCTTIAESIRFPGLQDYLEYLMQQEIAPLLIAGYQISSEELQHLKSQFIKRCLESTTDPVFRVGRDPMRKLDRGERLRGLLELRDKFCPDLKLPALERGIAAGILYGTKNYDETNPGVQKLKSLYQSTQRYETVLCYTGEAPSGNFTGLDPVTEKQSVKRIIKRISTLEQELTISSPAKFWLNSAVIMQQKLKQLGLKIDSAGHLFYKKHMPIPLTFELVLIRHGETYGNAGQADELGNINWQLVQSELRDSNKRIFQGNIDTQLNQLTKRGQLQAENLVHRLAEELLSKNWIPDIIFHSPLKRAKDTGQPFVDHNHFSDRYCVLDEITEMSFGALENRRICDLSPAEPGHLFYQQQNALVKTSGMDLYHQFHHAENFCEVLLRAHEVLQDLNQKYPGKKIMMFSHSMFGAACCILGGLGQTIENGTHLAFDGHRMDGTSYTMPHTTPFLLNFSLSPPQPLAYSKSTGTQE